MKAAALLAVLLWQTASANGPAQPSAMRYERVIRVADTGAGRIGANQTCASLDVASFPHAAASLNDLRIFPVNSAGIVHEVPYAITMSEAATGEAEAARVLNLGLQSNKDLRGDKIAFDLEMPQRAYTGVALELDPTLHDFIATATVTGADALGGKATALGSFTLFDLNLQRLSRDTSIPLAESTFKFLHVEMSVSSAAGAAAARFAPSMVLGAVVPPSREAQTVYTTVAETASLTTKGRETVTSFELPARVPVERVSFDVAPEFKGNFSREVRVSALTVAAKSGAGAKHVGGTSDDDSTSDSDDDERVALPEVVTGNILRVRTSQAGREIRSEQLGIAAVLGANLQRAAKVEVMIENGDDQPLPITAVRLEMRQRKICFDAPANTGASSGTGLALYYGDSELAAPVYDYARLFVASRTTQAATLGPETLNASYRVPAPRPFVERHPEVLWVVLIAVISALGLVAMHAAKDLGRG